MGGALFDTMAHQVAAQGDAAMADARQEADAIVAAAKEKADLHREETLHHTRDHIALLDKRAKLMAQSEAERAVLALRQELSNEVMTGAKTELQRIAESSDFAGIVESLLAEAMAAATGEVIVLAPADHVSLCTSWLQRNGHGSVRVEAEAGLTDGIAVQDPQRTYRITNTLSSRLRLVEGEARKRCLNRLFGEEG
jgi:vacuolar-type H+-ATPase subunit E/Vma4